MADIALRRQSRALESQDTGGVVARSGEREQDTESMKKRGDTREEQKFRWSESTCGAVVSGAGPQVMAMIDDRNGHGSHGPRGPVEHDSAALAFMFPTSQGNASSASSSSFWASDREEPAIGTDQAPSRRRIFRCLAR